ncbi:MAG TPA: hypothetical protein VF756_29470 [Thermoanaerobaculia bacterium]
MLTRSSVMAAALTIATFVTSAAQAQTYYFGVHSTSETLGYAGTYTDDSQLQAGGLFADTLSDPPTVTLSAPGNTALYADVASASEARQAELHGWASGEAKVLSGTYTSGAAPYGFSYSHFYDRLTVKSDVLPNGTPVQIVFGNDVEIHQWNRTGAYSGYIEITLQIGTGTARSRWSSHYLYGDTAAAAPQLVLNTTVGSRLSVDARLRVMAKVFYKVGANSANHADATARLVIREIPEGVTLEADSGIVYPIVPAN